MVELLEMGLSGLTGGLSGLIGKGLTGFMELKAAKQEHEQKLEVMQLQIQEARIEADANMAVARTQAAAQMDTAATQADAGAYIASLKDASKRISRKDDHFLIILADFVKLVTRPFITLLLIVLTAWIFWYVAHAAQPFTDIQKHIVQSVLYFAGLTISWWFCDRSKAPRVVV